MLGRAERCVGRHALRWEGLQMRRPSAHEAGRVGAMRRSRCKMLAQALHRYGKVEHDFIPFDT